ncbi:MAG: hypothetical protein ABJJ53_07385 [Sulfitobacter sp.]
MAAQAPLKDALFNRETVGQLAAEYAAAIPDFDADAFTARALGGFAERELMARLEWIADCIDAQLSDDFPTLADQLTAAMPPRLDPAKTDDDFGYFIHAVPGILAARHGLEEHRARAMVLLYEATQRFTVEFYIRPFLIRWPAETLAALADWAQDDNYHVRRLVSEGTRPRLPWAKNVDLTPEQSLPLLDALHADPTRYVTRSVSNHLNDLSKTVPDAVLSRLAQWRAEGKQKPSELAWMTRHALRTLIKQGHAGAMTALGYSADAPVRAKLSLGSDKVTIGDALQIDLELNSPELAPVLVDYRLAFARPNGKQVEKVFKLKVGQVKAGVPLKLSKTHKLKGDTTTFTLYEGAHRITVQVNGRDVAEAEFELKP